MSDFAAVVADAMSEPVPEPADDIVTLPGALLLDGQVIRQARIRELTGADEEAIARSGRTGILALLRTVMERCLVDVGGQAPTSKIQDSMLIGDRDAILLGIRRATYGNEYETRLTCPKCGLDTDIAFELDKDVPSRTLEDPEKGLRTVELRKGATAEVRLVAVADQADAMSNLERTAAEMNTILLGRCVMSINGQPTIGATTARNLSAGDRRILVDWLVANQPGPQMGEVVATCSHCGVESPSPLAMAALFL